MKTYNDDHEEEICSEVEDYDIAPSGYSAYGNGDSLKGAILLTVVFVEKRSNLGIVMGPRNRNRKLCNHVCGTDTTAKLHAPSQPCHPHIYIILTLPFSCLYICRMKD